MKSSAVLSLPLHLLLAIAVSLFAADMTVSYGGKSYVLHEDNTWEFENKVRVELDEGFEIPLDDDRVVELADDYTWRFIEKAELDERARAPVASVTAKGYCQHPVLSEASARAMKDATDKAAQKLKASLKNRKVNYAKLNECVKRVEKDVDSEENFTKGKGWSVSVNMVLDKGSILAVLDCEAQKEEKKEDAPPPKK